ncbi:MAG: YidC/Oxa1 family membrane protein insertase [Chloroflexota bacterium]
MGIWDTIAIGPMVNILIVLTQYLFSSFGLAIIALTVVVNLLMYPLTKRQINSTTAMQAMQPKLAELQKKYARDKQKLSQEQMKLYKEVGINPAGCLVPMLVQMPIWFALYQSIIRLLGDAPESLIDLPRFLYSWPMLHTAIPLGSRFLWLNLAQPDATMILPLLVGGSMWVQQKMVTPATADPRQQQQSKMMLWMMPLMFGFFALQFPSGLALFWVVSTLIRIIIQYFMTGWGNLVPQRVWPVAGGKGPSPEPVRSDAREVAKKEEKIAYEASGGKRQDRGGSYPASPGATRRKPRGGGGNRSGGS